MKKIKTLLLFLVALHANALLHAQETKTEMLKREKATLPKPPARTETFTGSEFIPMNGITPKTQSALTTETPSPFTKEQLPKPAGPAENVPAEKLNILNGTIDKKELVIPETEIK